MDAELAPPALAPATRGEIRRVFVGLMLALALASLDGNIVGPALPRILSDLGGLAHLSWVVTAFAVASTASTPLYGKLSDQYGRRPAFFVSIGLFLAGSVACGLARSMPELIGFRILQGLGAGGLLTLSQTTIADLVPPRERGRYQGWVAAVFALCSVAGPLLGGLITDLLSWPWIFFINLPVGAAALAIIARSLRPHQAPESLGQKRDIDIAGFALLIGGTCTGLLMLSWGGATYPWGSPPIIALFCITLLLFGVLIPVERAAPEAALPPRLFADPVFLRAVTAISLAATSLFGSLVFIPLFFQLVLGLSATEAGLRMAPMMGGLIVTSIIGGRLVTRTGRYKRYPVAGLVLAAAAYACMSGAAASGAGANIFDALLVLLGAGLGLTMPNLTTAIQNAVARPDLGVATATTAFFRSLGGAFGVAISGAILTGTLHARLPGAGGGGMLSQGLTQLAALDPAARQVLVGAYGHALAMIFAAASLVAAAAFVLVLGMTEKPLRGR